jgi:hypothetical protein
MSMLISGKVISGMAVATLLGLAAATSAQAQTAQRLENSMERGLKRVTSQPPAAINGAMTQAQARKACQAQFKGAKESKSAIRTKMNLCINEKMQGNS